RQDERNRPLLHMSCPHHPNDPGYAAWCAVKAVMTFGSKPVAPKPALSENRLLIHFAPNTSLQLHPKLTLCLVALIRRHYKRSLGLGGIRDTSNSRCLTG